MNNDYSVLTILNMWEYCNDWSLEEYSRQTGLTGQSLIDALKGAADYRAWEEI